MKRQIILVWSCVFTAAVAHQFQSQISCNIFGFLPASIGMVSSASLFESFGNESIFQAGIVTGDILWLLTYMATIKLGFERQTYGIPFIALAGNVAWEFMYAFIKTQELTPLQTTLNMAMFALDLVNVYLFLWYGRKTMWSKFPVKFRPKPSIVQFYGGCVGAFVLTFWILFTIENIFICTWLQSLVMSVSFLFFIPTRLLEDQSRVAAYLKMIGTLIAGVVTILYRSDSFTLEEYKHFVALVSATLILDVVYIWLLEREDYGNRGHRKSSNCLALINSLIACFVSFVIFCLSHFGLSHTQRERDVVAFQYTPGSAGNATHPDTDVLNPCVFL